LILPATALSGTGLAGMETSFITGAGWRRCLIAG
jgi:hypothetical protein